MNIVADIASEEAVFQGRTRASMAKCVRKIRMVATSHTAFSPPDAAYVTDSQDSASQARCVQDTWQTPRLRKPLEALRDGDTQASNMACNSRRPTKMRDDTARPIGGLHAL